MNLLEEIEQAQSLIIDDAPDIPATESIEKPDIFDLQDIPDFDENFGEVENETKAFDEQDSDDILNEESESKDYYKAAKWYVNTLDFFTAKICSAVSKEDEKSYRMKPDEKLEYIDISAEYFKDVDVSVSPTTLFFIMTAGLVGGNFWSAYSKYIENKKAVSEEKRAKAAIAKKLRDAVKKHTPKPRVEKVSLPADDDDSDIDNVIELHKEKYDNHVPKSESIERLANDSNNAAAILNRKSFAIDEKGYYTRGWIYDDKKGETVFKYIKKSDRSEKYKAPLEVLALYEQGWDANKVKKYMHKSVKDQMPKN